MLDELECVLHIVGHSVVAPRQILELVDQKWLPGAVKSGLALLRMNLGETKLPQHIVLTDFGEFEEFHFDVIVDAEHARARILVGGAGGVMIEERVRKRRTRGCG